MNSWKRKARRFSGLIRNSSWLKPGLRMVTLLSVWDDADYHDDDVVDDHNNRTTTVSDAATHPQTYTQTYICTHECVTQTGAKPARIDMLRECLYVEPLSVICHLQTHNVVSHFSITRCNSSEVYDHWLQQFIWASPPFLDLPNLQRPSDWYYAFWNTHIDYAYCLSIVTAYHMHRRQEQTTKTLTKMVDRDERSPNIMSAAVVEWIVPGDGPLHSPGSVVLAQVSVSL